MRSLYNNQTARHALQGKVVEERRNVARLDKMLEQEKRMIRVVEGKVRPQLDS